MYMSKTLEKNLAGKALKEYSRQFVGLVIGLRNKWTDPFVKSEINVIALQITFAVVLLLLTYGFFNYLYEEAVRTVISGISNVLNTGQPMSSNEIMSSLKIARTKNFGLFSTILAILTIIFAFLVAKITLRPAKDALNSQKRFISDVAHELRTPLTIIKTNNEVALMENNIDPIVKDMLKSNIEELDRVSEIINNILSFNKLVRPERIKFSNVDIGPIVDQSVNRFKELSEKNRLEIIVKKITPHIVWGNAVAIEQIISNLLKNAINYTQEDGRITIRVGPDYYGNVLIHIEDTGVGITKEDLMHIFEPFYRAEKSRNRRLGSSGLGLTIVSELVKMHSGRITIKSAENKGTVAIVTLPYGKNADIEEQIDLSKLNEVSINFLKKEKM